MNTCPACGAPHAATDRFCRNCGAVLSPPCARCGAELGEGARFCPSCGAPVPPRLEPPSSPTERKLVTVLFADIIESTGLGERLDPERLRDVMQAYFGAMRHEIESEGGTVEKFIGDAVMAVFGVPASHDDDGARALRAALRMRHALERLNEDLLQGVDLPLAMRIGVNTGEVVAVSVPKDGEGLVTGDPVNVAARLEHAAQPGQILVAERTARSTRGFNFASMGPMGLRGRERATQVYELIDTGPGAPVRSGRVRAPLVGRGREMALIESVFERAVSEGRPHLVTIYGEAGVGKSRLVEEVGASTAALPEPPSLLVGRCLPYGEGVTYWPLAEILKSQAGVLDSDHPDTAVRKIQAAADELLTDGPGSDPGRTVAALCFSVGLPVDAGPLREGIEPRQARAELADAWRAYLSALAQRGSVVLVVEDAHWGDPALLELIEELADRLEGPVLFLCTARREILDRRPTWGGGRLNFSSVLLEPLSQVESGRLLAFLLDESEQGTDEPTRTAILDRAGGNPFFLEELVLRLLDQGGAAEPGEIPDTVQGVLAARMDLLPQAEKRALQCSAVVGRAFWTGAVARITEQKLEHVEEALRKLADRGLIQSRLASTLAGDREWVFRHVLTRDVAYESLPRRERAAAHAAVAEWIESQPSGRAREFGELLAHHYGEALEGTRQELHPDPASQEALRRKAFEWSLAASEDARNRLNLDKARRLSESALSLAAGSMERAEALEALGEACFHDYEGDRAWQCLREATDLRLAEANAPDRTVARLCARALEIPARFPGFMREMPAGDVAALYLKEGLAHAGTEDSEALARLLLVKSFWPHTFGGGHPTEEALVESRAAGLASAEMAERLSLHGLASAALDGVAWSYIALGHYGPVEGVSSQRIELARGLDDPWEVGDAFASASWAAIATGRYREALSLATEGLDRTAKGSVAMAVYCLDWGAVARFRLGDWEGFVRDRAKAEALLAGKERPRHALQHVAVAALLHELRGERAASEETLAELAALGETDGPSGSFWEPWLARVHARRGDFDEARHRLALAMDDRDDRAELGLTMEARCDVLADEGRWDQVEAVLEVSRRHSEEAGLLALPAFADRLEGRWRLALSEPSSAEPLLQAAAEAFAGLEARWEAACTELLLAEALAASGRTGRAREIAGRSLETFVELRSVQEADRCRSLLEELGPQA